MLEPPLPLAARRAPRLAALALLAAAGGCTLDTDVAATGAAAGNVSHLWITVNEVWLATAADTPPESDAGWTKNVLPTPVTFDLATLSPGVLQQLLSQVRTAAGTYKQIHLVTADSGDALSASAQAAGLASNSQITITDSSGTQSTTALESPVPEIGITIATDLTLTGSFDLGGSSSTTPSTPTAGSGSTPASNGSASGSAASTATLALEIDAARDVLPYSYGASTGYLLSPVTSALDESRAGGISGTIDPSALAPGAGPISVSAELPDATNTHHVVVLRRVVGAGGAFTLYPLPAPTSGTVSYDLVIAGAGATTLIIRGVPLGVSTSLAPVVVQSTPLVLASAPTVYADVASQAAVLPGGARVAFYQTVAASGELPYQVDSTAVDLLTRRLPGDAFALGGGPLMVGEYANGDAVTFATQAPVEGNGGFVIGAEGQYRADTLTRVPAVISGSRTAPTPIVAPSPAIAAGGTAGALSVTLGATAGVYDSGFVVIAAGSRVVDAANVGALLATGGGTVTFVNVPAGSGLAAPGGVPYQVAVRAWNSTNATASFTRVAATSSTVLGNGASGSVTLQLE